MLGQVFVFYLESRVWLVTTCSELCIGDTRKAGRGTSNRRGAGDGLGTRRQADQPMLKVAVCSGAFYHCIAKYRQKLKNSTVSASVWVLKGLLCDSRVQKNM